MRRKEVVDETGQITRAKRPAEVSFSRFAWMVFVERTDHIVHETDNVNGNEAYVFLGKALDKTGKSVLVATF